jgi:hypothetical protein
MAAARMVVAQRSEGTETYCLHLQGDDLVEVDAAVICRTDCVGFTGGLAGRLPSKSNEAISPDTSATT